MFNLLSDFLRKLEKLRRYEFIPFMGLLLLVLGFLAHYVTTVNIPVLQPAGEVGTKELQLIIFASLLSLLVVVPVFVMTFFFVWKYRDTKQTSAYTPEWDHHAGLETIWWLIPTALILVLGVVIWRSSQSLDPYRSLVSSQQPLTIQVVALDWKWLFIYPDQKVASVNLAEFPKDTPVRFVITADAPMNSFWIPQLGGQIYAMPGMATELHLVADKTGSFRGSSANISGKGFPGMHFTARATSQADFDNWTSTLSQSKQTLDAASYVTLAKPSENNPVSFYTAYDPGLFGSIITKYMGPMTNSESLAIQ